MERTNGYAGRQEGVPFAEQGNTHGAGILACMGTEAARENKI